MGRQGVQRYRLGPLEIFKVLQGGPLSWKRKHLEWTESMGGLRQATLPCRADAAKRGAPLLGTENTELNQ